MATPLRALVTGAARPGGIGAAIARRLRRCREAVPRRWTSSPAAPIQVDLAAGELPPLRRDRRARLQRRAADDLRRGAHGRPRPLAARPPGQPDRLLPRGPGVPARDAGAAVPGGSTVISSFAAAYGMPAQVAYSASKAGLLGMVKTIAAENARARHHGQRRAARAGRQRRRAVDAAGDRRRVAGADPRRAPRHAGRDRRGGRVLQLTGCGGSDRPGARDRRRADAQCAVGHAQRGLGPRGARRSSSTGPAGALARLAASCGPGRSAQGALAGGDDRRAQTTARRDLEPDLLRAAGGRRRGAPGKS